MDSLPAATAALVLAAATWAFAAVVWLKRPPTRNILLVAICAAIVASIAAGSLAIPAARHALAIQAVYDAGGTIFYQEDPNRGYPAASAPTFAYGPVARVDLDYAAAQHIAPWQLNALPEMYDLMIEGSIGEDQLVSLCAHLRNHPGLKAGNFNVSGLTNRGLDCIAMLPLESLLISNTRIEPLDLTFLQSSGSLQELWLSGNPGQPDAKLTLQQLEALAGLGRLRRLYISHLDLTSEGARELIAELDGLEWLRLIHTGLTAEEIESLRTEMSQTEVLSEYDY